MATLQQIQITDYEFIDKVQEAGTQQKKVIAQQVAEVFPQAVEKQITEVVPDIYQAATINATGWVTFNDESFELTNDLAIGDKVRIYIEEDRELLEVLEVKDNRFRVLLPTGHPQLSTDHFQPSTVFVYGRQVHDFHTVDYQALSMLNVSATQQLAKENEALKEEIAQLKLRVHKIDQLEQQNSEMKAMLEQIQQRLDHQWFLLFNTPHNLFNSPWFPSEALMFRTYLHEILEPGEKLQRIILFIFWVAEQQFSSACSAYSFWKVRTWVTVRWGCIYPSG